MEQWKAIVGWEGAYEVSNLGRVRSVDRIITHFTRWGHARPFLHRGRILKTLPQTKGYYVAGLRRQGQGKKWIRVHRLVAKAFIPNPLNLPEVNHKSGKKRNNAVSNLEWVTSLQNLQHAISLGLIGGPNHHFAKLTVAQVKQIRKMYKGRGRGVTQRFIGNMFNVDDTVIGDIINRRTWKHVL